jgi:hypothetical protein
MVLVDRPQIQEEFVRLGEVSGRRRIEKPESFSMGRSPARKFERKRRKIGIDEFRLSECGERGMIAFTPKAVTRSRSFSPCPAPPLIGTRLRNRNGHEPRHPAPRVKARAPCQTRVNDDPDAVDGKARFCDACR